MATIKEFKALRPVSALVSKVAALPYDVYSSEEARKAALGNEYSFLRVDKPEITFDEPINLYDEAVYQRAKENLQFLIESEALKKDVNAGLYIYRLEVCGRQQTGLVALTSVDEYLDGTIKKHELTREDKEKDRIKHVDVTNAHTGPIFLAYRANTVINEMIQKETAKNPVYCFTSDDSVTHTVWVIDNCETIKLLKNAFAGISNFYIADGHHRNASAVKVAQMRREKDINFTGDEEYNYYLSVLFPHDELRILDYNRVVRDISDMTTEAFLEKLSKSFIVEKCSGGIFTPKIRHTFGLYIDNSWYKLTAKDSVINENDAVASLDVSILQKELLTDILGINDPRTDKRIDFVGGIRGLQVLSDVVDSKEYRFAVAMYPTSLTELFNVADNDKIMPPKSTWFEPKLRSGIFIHSLE